MALNLSPELKYPTLREHWRERERYSTRYPHATQTGTLGYRRRSFFAIASLTRTG